MPSFQADLPANEVHTSLLESIAELHRAEQCAVLWFSEVQRRKLYRDLGFSSLQRYAREAPGFSDGKFYQFLRLTDALAKLPNLREAMATGEIGWTKARTVASVAPPRTEARWVREAKRSSRRQLEQAVQRIKRRGLRRAAIAFQSVRPIQRLKSIWPAVRGRNLCSQRWKNWWLVRWLIRRLKPPTIANRTARTTPSVPGYTHQHLTR